MDPTLQHALAALVLLIVKVLPFILTGVVALAALGFAWTVFIALQMRKQRKAFDLEWGRHRRPKSLFS